VVTEGMPGGQAPPNGLGQAQVTTALE